MKQDGLGTVLPSLFQRNLDSPVLAAREPVLAQRRPGHVAAELLETAAIAPVDRRSDIHVDATYLGDLRGTRHLDGNRPECLLGPLSRFLAQELKVAGRSAVTRGESRVVGSEGLGGLKTPMPFEHAHQACMRPGGDLAEVFGARIPEGEESWLSRLVDDPCAVGDQAMKVRVQTGRGIEALNERDGSDLRVVNASEPAGALGLAAQEPHQRLDESLEDVGTKPAIKAYCRSDGKWQAANPLTMRNDRQDGLHQMGSHIGHPTTATRGAPRSALAGPRDHNLMAAVPAREACEPVFEYAAAQVLLELAHHETREAPCLVCALEKLVPVLLDDLVQEGILGATSGIAICPRSNRFPGCNARGGRHERELALAIACCLPAPR